MKSIMIEFLRFGGEPGILGKGDRYLRTSGSNPATDFSMPLDEGDFLDQLANLRYYPGVEEVDRKAALEKLAGAVTEILNLPKLPDEPIQLDIVASAAELWALPFEAATDSAGSPLFVNPDKVVIPTRRIRQDFAERTPQWPVSPRVLFAAASPKWLEHSQVPAEEHKEALRAALKPWIEPLEEFPEVPDERPVLHILDGASLEDIENACKKAGEEGKPFTHVHILAHGIEVAEKNRPHRSRFGLALDSAEAEPTEADKLVEAMMVQGRAPMVVTLAVCDGGNDANSIVPAGSLAQTLHRSGVPVVVASQFPLTIGGSTVVAKEFYGALLSGADVRMALYQARVALYQASETAHDWVSLLAYVQLPEGYADHLLEVRLAAELASLKTAQVWADHIIEYEVESTVAFDRVAGLLRDRIITLKSSLEDNQAQATRPGLLEENAGLLGSAYKRLAELLFIRASIDQDQQWLDESRQALESARQSYVAGHEYNLSHHWTGVQHLSLEAILTGRIKQVGYWHAALRAAEIARSNDKEYWAQGSIAELLLLGPLAGQDSRLDEARVALVEMKKRVRDHDDYFPIESTLRQLKRYTKWWTRENGYCGDQEDLAKDARRLIQVLEGPN